jgi:creatinine amidohydrolase
MGVIEEHGPHLPLGTDIYWSYAICKKIKNTLGMQNADLLIAPPFYLGKIIV